MKKYNEWKETIGAAAPTDVPAGNAFDDTHIGPQNRLSARVNTASSRFDKTAGDSLSGMSVNQKLHFLADTIMSMTGQDEDMVSKDRQLLTKLRSMVLKIDAALKRHAAN
jgi:hypothetical protein